MYLIKYCFQGVKLEFRRVPECRILYHLPQSFGGPSAAPSHTATALYVVEGYVLDQET